MELNTKKSFTFSRPWTGAAVATSCSYLVFPLLWIGSRGVFEPGTWASLESATSELWEVIGTTLIFGALGIITGVGVILWFATLIVARMLISVLARIGGGLIVFLIGSAGLGVAIGGLFSMLMAESSPLVPGLLAGVLSGVILRQVSGPIRVDLDALDQKAGRLA